MLVLVLLVLVYMKIACEKSHISSCYTVVFISNPGNGMEANEAGSVGGTCSDGSAASGHRQLVGACKCLEPRPSSLSRLFIFDVGLQLGAHAEEMCWR